MDDISSVIVSGLKIASQLLPLALVEDIDNPSRSDSYETGPVLWYQDKEDNYYAYNDSEDHVGISFSNNQDGNPFASYTTLLPQQKARVDGSIQKFMNGVISVGEEQEGQTRKGLGTRNILFRANSLQMDKPVSVYETEDDETIEMEFSQDGSECLVTLNSQIPVEYLAASASVTDSQGTVTTGFAESENIGLDDGLEIVLPQGAEFGDTNAADEIALTIEMDEDTYRKGLRASPRIKVN